jgi:hypothetical protein
MLEDRFLDLNECGETTRQSIVNSQLPQVDCCPAKTERVRREG